MAGGAAKFFLLLSTLLSTWGSPRAADVVHAVRGHVAHLECRLEDTQDGGNVTALWTRSVDRSQVVSTSRIKAHGATLWFLPSAVSDSGTYSCNASSGSGVPSETKVLLSVTDRTCPHPSEVWTIQAGSTLGLPCRLDHVLETDGDSQVSWFKDCKPIDHSRIVNVTISDAGNYSCVVEFTHEGEEFTASWTISLNIQNDVPVQIECTVLPGGDPENEIYWIVNQSFIAKYPELHQNLSIERREDGQLYAVSTLTITAARPEFFQVPFACVAFNPAGRDVGHLQLIPVHSRHFYTCMVSLGLFMLVIVALYSLCCAKDCCRRSSEAADPSATDNACSNLSGRE
ncbi:interleukin-1 receptor type 2-like isoform X2 [Denticeps clupeoides]|uniref:interleukin-1 receptor type 2-like isoform X2 n=1 Tax=Denticeps clupeoides TaxID=299321 RepID=UPI0010A388D4|nr:interleukin-1 receptor type 2-like isoform X2 [Denticeps clupeoides]